jgi:hypothetical protein
MITYFDFPFIVPTLFVILCSYVGLIGMKDLMNEMVFINYRTQIGS